MDIALDTPIQPDALARDILWNADYGDSPDGTLTNGEIWGLHQQVTTALSTTNGDAGTHEISTRQLALLLACAVKSNEMQKSLNKIKELLKQHPEFSDSGSKVNFCAHLARSASSLK